MPNLFMLVFIYYCISLNVLESFSKKKKVLESGYYFHVEDSNLFINYVCKTLKFHFTDSFLLQNLFSFFFMEKKSRRGCITFFFG